MGGGAGGSAKHTPVLPGAGGEHQAPGRSRLLQEAPTAERRAPGATPTQG